jgi:hypothetical protein
MKIRELAAARAGDKGSVLDITLVAFDEQAFTLIEQRLTAEAAARWLHRAVDGPVIRHVLPRLLAVKFVMPEALSGGLYASLHAGLHWQKAAGWLLLDEELPGG